MCYLFPGVLNANTLRYGPMTATCYAPNGQTWRVAVEPAYVEHFWAAQPGGRPVHVGIAGDLQRGGASGSRANWHRRGDYCGGVEVDIFFWCRRDASERAPCSLGLSAISQQYFSLRTNQSSATSQQYFSLTTNQHRPSATNQTNRLPPAYAVPSCAQKKQPGRQQTPATSYDQAAGFIIACRRRVHHHRRKYGQQPPKKNL
jgi:hypothetical protein